MASPLCQLKNLALNETLVERQILRNWVTRCGPDGIRTRDLGLDRAACLAATPRDHSS